MIQSQTEAVLHAFHRRKISPPTGKEGEERRGRGGRGKEGGGGEKEGEEERSEGRKRGREN